MAGLQRGYDANVGTVNADTAKSLQQAYISYMMNQKNLGQQLAALGRSGGASETALLGLYNQYGQNRGTLEDTRKMCIRDSAQPGHLGESENHHGGVGGVPALHPVRRRNLLRHGQGV